MEFKAIHDKLNVINEATKALKQIKKLKYDTELRSRGIANIYSMGIAFVRRSSKNQQCKLIIKSETTKNLEEALE